MDAIQVSPDLDFGTADDTLEGGDGSSDPEKFFFQYLCQTYQTFLAGSDDFDFLTNQLNANFGTLSI